MRSIFTVTEPNNGGLLTTEEATAALGIADTSRDDDVDRLVAKVSAAIYRACNLRTDGIAPPTLLSEEVTDSFRFPFTADGQLLLSRRRVTEIMSLTEAGAALAETAYEIDRAAGLIRRLNAVDAWTSWPAGTIVVAYVAGFETVPEDLKLAAEMWLRTLWHGSYETPGTVADTSLKVDDIPGVRRIERFAPDAGAASSSAKTLLPAEVQSILIDGGYIEHWIA